MCFLIVGFLVVAGCSHDSGSSVSSAGPSEPAQDQPTQGQAAVAAATGPLTDGTTTRMSNGTIVDTCSSQVLLDYDTVIAASDVSAVDFMSRSSMDEYRRKSETARANFNAKYPNIKCGYYDGRTEISICASTNSTIQCRSEK
jgi:hypothetical protein